MLPSCLTFVSRLFVSVRGCDRPPLQLPSEGSARLSALEERIQVQTARLEQAERERRRWQCAFRRLSTSLQTTAQQPQQHLDDARTDAAANQPLDAVCETDEERMQGGDVREESSSDELAEQSLSAEAEDSEAVQQAALIATLIADRQQTEKRRAELHARLYGTLSRAGRWDETGRDVSATDERQTVEDVSPAQLEEAWSVCSNQTALAVGSVQRFAPLTAASFCVCVST